MKVKYLTIAIVLGSCLFLGLRSKTPRFEHACFVYAPDTLALWETPEQKIDTKHISDLYKKLDSKIPLLSFPPEWPIIDYAGGQGWELVAYVSQEDSIANYYIYWFKRPKS